MRQLIALQNKLKLICNPTLETNDIENELKIARKQRGEIKLLAEDLSLEYRTRLVIANEEAGELKAAVSLCNQNRVEEQRRVSRNTRRMRGKMKGGGHYTS